MKSTIRFRLRPHWVSSFAVGVVALTALCASAQPLPMASPESVGMSTERLGKLTAMLQKEVADKKQIGRAHV